MRYVLALLVVALFGLSAPVAQAKRFTFGGTIDGEPDSSIHFDLEGNRKGTKFRSIEHITVWEVPLDCEPEPDRAGFFFMFGPFPVDDGAFTASFNDGTTSVALAGTITRKGKKASGTFTGAADDGCATNGGLPWTGKRLKQG